MFAPPMPEIPFRFQRGLLSMPIEIVHGGFSSSLSGCILDTGSAGTTFDTDRMAGLGIKSTPESKLRRLVAVGGHQTVFTRRVDTILLGGLPLHDIEIEVGNLNSKFGIEGIIGTDLMRRFDWEIRFSDMTLELNLI